MESRQPALLLVFTVIYAVVVIVAVTDQKNTRPGASMARRPGVTCSVNKFYMDRHGSNLLLTQHFHIGIDGYKHKHNTNILIVSGPVQARRAPRCAECTGMCLLYGVTDPKSEILRKTGNLLKQKGYGVIVF